jgi:hypothetical protein
MSPKKLELEALVVETFEPGEDVSVVASLDTFATTGGGWFCAANCDSGTRCGEACG